MDQCTKKGSYTVILIAGEETLELQCHVSGHSSVMSSYCAELSGILALYHLLSTFTSFTKQDIVSNTEMYCNNNTAVAICSTAESWPRIRAQLAPDIGMFIEIKQLKASVPVTPSWVKAHQDKRLDADARKEDQYSGG
eukprot:15146585-Ditylum_brightwellii.AAC.2